MLLLVAQLGEPLATLWPPALEALAVAAGASAADPAKAATGGTVTSLMTFATS